MLKQFFILSFILILSNLGMAQTEITWNTLGNVEFSEKYYEMEGGYYLFPTFGETVKELEGEEVYLKGFILSIDPETNYYLLSMNPWASCFFCGAAGPETVVELEFKESPDLQMDDVVTIKGKLKLNDDNLYQCNYIFEEAEIYDEY